MTTEPCDGCRRRLGTAQLVGLVVLLLFAAQVVVDLARAAGGWAGGLLWFVGAVGLGWCCGLLAERITGDGGDP